LPLIDTAPRPTWPVVVVVLIAMNTVVFLWMWSLPPWALNGVLEHYALIPIRYSNPVLAVRFGLDPHNFWPLLTNTFMHGGWLHLIFNMWFLWIFGPAMEGRFGRTGFAVLYVAGAVVASTADAMSSPTSTIPVLGASGAIAAVIAAYVVIYPSARVVTLAPLGFIPLLFRLPAILFGLVWFGLQVIQGTSQLAAPTLAAGVAWWAHIGGFAFGALFAFVANGFKVGASISAASTSVSYGKRVPDIKLRH
jgi:rhomboid family protein